MKKSLIGAAALLTSLLFLFSGLCAYAWFANRRTLTVGESGGGILKQYFHQGDGTAEHPYEITRPVHYYNLVMLYQANPGTGDGGGFIDGDLHFAVGSRDLDLDGMDDGEGLRVYHYEDDGTTDGTADGDGILNLAAYGNGAAADGLFPIGSAEKPFGGHFEGNGFTLAHVRVVGTVALNGVTAKTPDVGLFGYVGAGARIGNLYAKDLTVDLTDTDGAAEYQIPDSARLTHQSHEGEVFVGYLAGHIVSGAQIRDVYVNDCRVTGGNAARSGFGFFGRVEDETGKEVPALGALIASLRSEGTNSGFGGSLDMKKILERLDRVFEAGTRPLTYDTAERIVINEQSGSRTVKSGESANITLQSSSYPYRLYSSPYAGEYYFYRREDMANHRFMCLYGEDTLNPKMSVTVSVGEKTKEAFRILRDGRYLTVTDGAPAATADRENAGEWMTDAAGHLYVYGESFEYLYLCAGENTSLSLSTSPTTVFEKDEYTGALYCLIGNVRFALAYQGGWTLVPAYPTVTLTGGNGHFLASDGSHVVSRTVETGASVWYRKPHGSSCSFFRIEDGRIVYLSCDGTLTLGQTETVWTPGDGSFHTSVGDTVYTIIYNEETDVWSVAAQGIKITDGNGHYLSRLGTLITDADGSSSAVWQKYADGENVGFTTVAGGNVYYLSYAGELTLSQTPFVWQISGDGFTVTQDGLTLALSFRDGAWGAFPLSYFTLGAGGHYLKMISPDVLSETAEESRATKFSLTDSGALLFCLGGKTHYLGADGFTVADRPTAFDIENGLFRVRGTETYLTYDGGFILSDTGVFHTVSSGTHYLSVNSDGTGLTDGGSASATLWKFSDPDTPAGTARARGTALYLSARRSGACNNYAYSLSLAGEDGASVFTKNGRRLVSGNASLRYDGGWTAGEAGSGTQLTLTKVTVTPLSLTATPGADEPAPIREEEAALPDGGVTLTENAPGDFSLSFEETLTYRVSVTERSGLPGGYRTYFPLRIAEESVVDENGETKDSYDKTAGWFDASDPFRVSLLNTGYIVSGARILESDAAAGQKVAGDIRISYFPIPNIDGSYLNGALTAVYTADKDGIREKTDTSDVYENAKAGLLRTLDGSDSVYGLHFMDARISAESLLTAERAVILGREYEGYEMPLDSIDFHLVERGRVCFFAGAYFDGSDAFFSLHRVFRDEKQRITGIFEIAEIFEDREKGGSLPYLYRLRDENGEIFYTNPDGSFNGAREADLTEYVSAFDTSWITDPGITTERKLYYFEIPVNSGEYCLGSVPGKTGAYLVYLDIAANGGDTLKTAVASGGSAPVSAFGTDFRDAPDTLADGGSGVLYFSVNAPGGTDETTFSVAVSFDARDTSPAYEKGVYTLSVVNRSEEDLTLDVFLCDGDADVTNGFAYAYRIVYTNADRTEETLGGTCYQTMASFRIPGRGGASETTVGN